jgi:predicted tellurium resistance membrane protein TerC
MITAVIIALGIMLVFAGSISDFVNRHPTLKMLALSFLILIGVTLVGESLGQHIPKGYIYFSMAFAFLVEMLNLKLRTKTTADKPVELHQPYR